MLPSQQYDIMLPSQQYDIMLPTQQYDTGDNIVSAEVYIYIYITANPVLI